MNKIKFVYDLLETIKQKENLKGSLNMVGVKDNTKVFEMNSSNGFYFHNKSLLNHEHKLNKAKLLLSTLNHMKIEKNRVNGYTLSLISDKMSKDLQDLLFEIINSNTKEENNFIKQFHESKEFKFQVKLSISNRYEIKKSIVEIENPQSKMKLNVNVKLI
ncbi:MULTISPECIES: hypothetical protein [Clostridium]|uniref:Uncharacterized protein n=1 Tax=Clostridium lapidicellarium TaxID=3240931 RepID=A0ABV4E0J7_9CLOT